MITLFKQQLPSDNNLAGTSSENLKQKRGGTEREEEEESFMKTPPPKKLKTKGCRMDGDDAELDETGSSALRGGKTEDISDSHNRTSQSALQRNQIRGLLLAPGL